MAIDHIKDRPSTTVLPDGAAGLPQRLCYVIRSAAWLVVAALVVLTVVPSFVRPVLAAPHTLEHFASFALAGALQYLGYPGRLLPWLIIAVVFAGALELLQIPIPSRHAAFADFLTDALGGCVGVMMGFLLTRGRTAR